MKTLLLNYLRYNHWANEKICNYLSGIDEKAHSNGQSAELGVIKKIVLHIADGEQTWQARLNGQNIPHMHNLHMEDSFAAICDLVTKNSASLIEFIGQKDEGFLNANTEYVNLKGKTFTQNNAEIILHCMNHSTFHRGQIISMLRHVGYTDQSASDFIMFLREKFNKIAM